MIVVLKDHAHGCDSADDLNRRIFVTGILARATYRKAGVPDPDSALIFFHGLGLSHMEPAEPERH